MSLICSENNSIIETCAPKSIVYAFSKSYKYVMYNNNFNPQFELLTIKTDMNMGKIC